MQPALVTEPASVTQAETVQQPASAEFLGRGMRKKKTSVKLRDYVCNTTFTMNKSTVSQELSNDYGIENYVNCERFSMSHKAFPCSITQGVVPKFFAEAMKDPRWREAMRLEIEAQERNQTWLIEHLPPAKMSTVRLVLQVAAGKNWELHQMDVHNVFLHGDLDEEVFMRVPQGFGASKKGMEALPRPVEFPMEQNYQLGRSMTKILADPEKYRRLVGRLIYLAATRPDLAYSVHILS
ncbi:uncharacterized protein LOC112084549 [Eutrema salsugineum]|uniref:uncharacterized protein LOC112084549 n=1 Tax=Eutrema salsugineum TaxID=72664 RepID=UPI000CED02F2|nr:uncharacterized protein LOC112084549 [Eutrema salsugineum]